MSTPPRSRRASTDLPTAAPPAFPTRRTVLPVHPLVLLAFLLVAFALLIVGGLSLVTAQSVVVIIEGVRRDVRTRQATVGGLLDELDVFIEPPDRVTPALETAITEGIEITVDKARPVIIDADDRRLRVLTHNTVPAEILHEFGVALRDGDALYVDGAPADPSRALEAFSSFRVQRAIEVLVVDAGDEVTIRTTGRTVGEALAEGSYPLFLADRVTPSLDALIGNGAVITVRRSWPIHVQVDGRLLDTRSAAETVGAALADAGVALVGLDYTIPAEDATTFPDMTIRVVRVTETDEIERTEIAFRQVVQTDTSIAPDTQRVIQPGQSGIRERRVRIRLEDGVEVSRSEPREAVVRDPQDEIIAVGARPSLITTPTPDALPPNADS